MSAMTQHNLEGQRALVTGATSGIGRAVALQLGRDGGDVVVHGRDAVRGANTVEEISAAGGTANFVAADLGDATDVARLPSDVGEVDILINNAGIALFGPTAEFDVSAFDRMFASNVRGAILPRSGVRSRDGRKRPRQHRQPQQHGRRRRARGRRGLRRDQGIARVYDARLGRRVQPKRCARQRGRPRSRLHPDAVRLGAHHGARRNNADAPRLTTRGDRRGRRVPRLVTGQLHHRHHHRRRRGPQGDLAEPSSPTQIRQKERDSHEQPAEPVAGTQSNRHLA